LIFEGRFGRVVHNGNRTRSGTVHSGRDAQAGRGPKSSKRSKKSKRPNKGRRPGRAQPEQPKRAQVAAYVTEESFKTNPDKNSSFQVRVSPKAAQGAIIGWMDDGFLNVRILAAADGGRANIEILRLLGHELQIPVGNLSIIRGSSSTTKLVKVVGLDEEEVRRRLTK
jgi:uncharacterized protein YggU (UPF0235/DUF167 family)